MRLWSLHPQYLDSKGLVALWREALLAKHVLKGKTKGYRNHAQLQRFKAIKNPVSAMNQYLSVVYQEALDRGYHFNKNKINWDFKPITLTVTKGQIQFEARHLLKKLKKRNSCKFDELRTKKKLIPHPLFQIINGNIEKWEIIKNLI